MGGRFAETEALEKDKSLSFLFVVVGFIARQMTANSENKWRKAILFWVWLVQFLEQCWGCVLMAAMFWIRGSQVDFNCQIREHFFEN